MMDVLSENFTCKISVSVVGGLGKLCAKKCTSFGFLVDDLAHRADKFISTHGNDTEVMLAHQLATALC